MITSAAFAGKRYAVLGLARSGAATVESLLASGAEVTAWDRQENARERFEGRCKLADPLAMDLSGFDALVVSPGVPLNTHPITPHAARYGVRIIGDIELFAQARGKLPPHKVIGVTGTNGKSTTVALVHHILREAGVPSLLGGNIGEPILAQKPLVPGEHGEGVYVLELSSYQIDLTFSLDCDAAALTNITPDHLDRYDGFEAYAAAKARLFEMQSPRNLAVFGSIDAPCSGFFRDQQGRRIEGRAIAVDPHSLAGMQGEWPTLQGPHNLQNVAVAIALVEECAVSEAQWREALKTFRNLPHRMEFVCEDAGVIYINDSKATNTASSAPALAAYPPDDGGPRVHWIVGGLAKEGGLGECEAQLDNVLKAYTVGEAGPLFADLIAARGVGVERCELVSEAVRRAREAARPGDVVLFSPACASFDQFRDYEKRGEHFRQLVGVMADDASDCAPETRPEDFKR
jgi:UDP-N-acetylmuramoylalanine--D-glutamate ligase